MRRPMTQVFKIELRAACLQDTTEVVPLPFRRLTAGAIPFQLAEDGVFRGRHCAFHGLGPKRETRLEAAARKRHSAVRIVAQRKNVELEGSRVMNQVKGTPSREG